MRHVLGLVLALAVAGTLVVACGDDDSSAPSNDGSLQDLQRAEDVNAAEDEAKSVVGTIGEPAHLVNDFGQDLMITLRSVDVADDAEHGRLLIVDVVAENSTDEAQNAPEFELRCGDDEETQPFYGGTYDWQEMPAGTLLEGTREFAYPDSCADPELWATSLVSTGESVRWDVMP